MSNPILKKLGYSSNERVVVLHADDIGMCHASVEAYAGLLQSSQLSAAATMVSCGWFPATAQLVREQAANAQLDMGVHLTITSEWDAMRWGPLSTGDVASGLMDEEGYFYRDVAQAQSEPTLAALEAELRAQIERALTAGIDVTHIDTHMGTMLSPRYVGLYAQLGFKYGVPTLAARASVEQLVARGYGVDSAEKLAHFSSYLEQQGMPLFDTIDYLPLREKTAADERFEHAKQMLGSLQAGLHYFIIHPSTDTPELRALAPDWQARVGDYELFLSDRWQRAVAASGVKVIGMKALRDVMKQG